LSKHYSPKAKLLVLEWSDEADLNVQLATLHVQRPKAHIICHSHIPSSASFGRISVMPRDPEAYARAIYAELHRSDDEGAEVIVVEALHPETA